MKTQYFCIMVVVLLGGCSPPDQEGASIKKTPQNEPDSAIVAKLQEVVELRESEFRGKQLESEIGTGTGTDDGTVAVALAKARVDLAREQGQADQVLTELRNLVTRLDKILESEKILVKEGRRTASSVTQLRVALLEAEVRLRREEIAQPGIEQIGDDRPATASESKSEGKKSPESDSEGCPQ